MWFGNIDAYILGTSMLCSTLGAHKVQPVAQQSLHIKTLLSQFHHSEKEMKLCTRNPERKVDANASTAL